jgi:hypothetical protein
MAGQARVLRVTTGCESPVIIAARACPAPLALLAQALSAPGRKFDHVLRAASFGLLVLLGQALDQHGEADMGELHSRV